MTPPFEPDGAYSWWRLAVSIVAATVAGVGMWVVVLVLPEVQAEQIVYGYVPDPTVRC